MKLESLSVQSNGNNYGIGGEKRQKTQTCQAFRVTTRWFCTSFLTERGSFPHRTTSQTLRNPRTDFRSQILQVIEAPRQTSLKSTYVLLNTNREKGRQGGKKTEETERDNFMKDRDASWDSFPGGGPSGSGYFLRLHKEDKMSSSIPEQPEYNIRCQIKCSLDKNEPEVCKLYYRGAADPGTKLS